MSSLPGCLAYILVPIFGAVDRDRDERSVRYLPPRLLDKAWAQEDTTRMDRVGIGLIGCGGMGMSVVRKLLALDEPLEVRGIFDPDERSIKRALEEIATGPCIFDSFGELVSSPEIEWVMIASWNCFHKEQTVASLEAGKHVFCQKPLATTLEDVKSMFDAWRKADRMFNLGFSLRYSNHYRRIRSLIEEGVVGDLISFEFNETLDFNHGGYIMGDWRRLQKNAGTHLLEKCCHDIDLANWMVGSRVRRVASFGGLNFFTKENQHHIERIGRSREGKEAYSTWRGLVKQNPFTSHKDICDNQVVIIEYENGVRATFHTNCHAAIPERRMYVLGTEGAIRADLGTGLIESKRIGFETEKGEESSSAPGGHGGGDEILVKELAESMLKGVTPTVGMEEGLQAAVTCFAIDQAADRGEVVDLGPFWKFVGL